MAEGFGFEAGPAGTPGTSFRCAAATDPLDGGTPVVSVMGEVDRATAPALERELRGVSEESTSEVIVDLTGCSFLDSSGLAALVTTRARLQRSNRSLTLVLSESSHVPMIFEITGFDELFEIYPSLGAAVGGNGHGNVDGPA